MLGAKIPWSLLIGGSRRKTVTLSERLALELSDQVVIVTGASRGIGKCIALTLSRLGARVVVAAKSERERLPHLPGSIHQTVQAIEAEGGEALAVATDMRDSQHIERLVERSVEHFGSVDHLINNAGALSWESVLETPTKRFDLVMAVNVRGAFLLSQQVAKHLVERGSPGHIISMSPPLDTSPHPGMVAYTISKFGMTSVALGLAEELRPHHIACNALWPATLVESQATINWGMKNRSQWRKPDIMADAVVEILKKESSYTGQSLIDEHVLSAAGVTDFSSYRVDPEVEPPHVGYGELLEL